MEECLICKIKYNNARSLNKHINGSHHLSGKEYYDNYIKKETDGICLVCGNKTSYRGYTTGYLKTCSLKCNGIYKKLNGCTKYWLGKKQPKEMILKRIKKTNQEEKENKRKITMLKRYGYSNPGQDEEKRRIASITKKGVPQPRRNNNHQRNIILSKIRNGNTKHSEETKRKISFAVSGDKNPFLLYLKNGGSLPKTSGGISGYYKNIYFRSSLELAFLYEFCNKYEIISAEKNFRVSYINENNLDSIYCPDFYIKETDEVIELKPKSLLNTPKNILKFQVAKKHFKNFKVLTEENVPYLKKEVIDSLVKNSTIILDEKSYKKLERYKH
jgi:hypothetical protein